METMMMDSMRQGKTAMRLAAVLAAFAFALGFALVASPQAQATTYYTSGSYEYYVSDGVAHISDYTGSATTLEIPSTLGSYTVTVIDEEAFYNCTKLQTLSFADSIRTISEGAFYGCSSLKTVTLPVGLTSLEKGAFMGCTALSTLVVNSRSLSVNDGYYYKNGAYRGAFENAGTLSSDGISVTFGSTCTSVPDCLFWATEIAPNVTSVSIPSTVTSVGCKAFYNCSDLTSATLPTALQTISEYAFYGCTSLGSVNLASLTSLRTIDEGAFCGCTSLKSVTLPKALKTLGESAFENCTAMTKLKVNSPKLSCDFEFGCSSGAFPNAGISGSGINVTFGSSVKTVPAYLLYTYSSTDSANIAKITVPATVSSIGERAFTGLSHYTLAGYKGSAAWTYYKANKGDDSITWKNLGTLMSYATVTLSKTSYTCNGKKRTPKVTVKVNGKKLSSKNYSVSYPSGRKAIGSYKVTVKGKGSYAGTVTKTFTIEPGKVTLKRARGGNDKFTAKWGKVAGGVKYQIAYKRSYCTWSYVTVSAKTLKTTVKEYSSGRGYKVKVRCRQDGKRQDVPGRLEQGQDGVHPLGRVHSHTTRAGKAQAFPARVASARAPPAVS